MTTQPYSELQIDALRELAGVGSGNAAAVLSEMLGRPLELSVPRARVLPIADTMAEIGTPSGRITGVAMPVTGDIDAAVLLVFSPRDAVGLCRLLGVDPDSEIGVSALGEIGNLVAAACVTALGDLTGMELDPHPPRVEHGRVDVLVSALLGPALGAADTALLLDSQLDAGRVRFSLLFILVPERNAVAGLLTRLEAH